MYRGYTTAKKWVFGSLVKTTVGLKHKPKSHTRDWIVESAFGNGGWFNIRLRSYVYHDSVGQFTGITLNDKTPIFCGDILAYEFKGKDLEWSVFFSNGCFMSELYHKGQPTGLIETLFTTIERRNKAKMPLAVIANTYERGLDQ